MQCSALWANAASAVQTGQFRTPFAYEANKQAAAAVNAAVLSSNDRSKEKPLWRQFVQIFVP